VGNCPTYLGGYIELPVITVGIVRGRDNQKWFDIALNSVYKQVYRNYIELDVVVLENFDRSKSIGKCYNEIAEKAKGDWVFYLGDDDHIVPEYLLSLVLMFYQMKKLHTSKKIVNIVSYSTIFGEGHTKEISTKSPTGMWLKDYVLANPFDETLKSAVDTEMFKRLNLSDVYYPCVAAHQYGYYYRQHKDNVSGNKFDRHDYDKKRPRVMDFSKAKKEEIEEIKKIVNSLCSLIKARKISEVETDKHIIGLISKSGAVYPINEVLGEFI